MKMLEINKKNIIITLIIIVAIITIIIVTNISENKNEEEWLEAENTLQENQQTKENMQTQENKIIVHITGQVINNGIVEINEGGRIIDAIEKAGGVTEEADLSKVNLAFVLTDGQKIHIPSINEKNEIEFVTQSSGENIIVEKDSLKKEGKLININTANEEQLQELQGIGASMAKRIIEYRKTNGKFNKIDDLKNVSGIGEAKYNKIKDYICIK